MPFCTNCGKPIKEQQKFCGSCGMPVEPANGAENTAVSPAPANIAASPITPPAVSGEAARVIIPALEHAKSLGRKDSYYLIVTDRRSIFAKITEQVMQKAIQMNREKNPDQGKGFFGRWKAQVAGPNIYLERYKTLSPEQALADSPENFAIDNSQIQTVRCKFYFSEDSPSEWHLEFQTNGNSYKFVTTTNSEKLLKQVYTNVITK